MSNTWECLLWGRENRGGAAWVGMGMGMGNREGGPASGVHTAFFPLHGHAHVPDGDCDVGRGVAAAGAAAAAVTATSTSASAFDIDMVASLFT